MRHIIPKLKDYSAPINDVPKNIYTSTSNTYSKTWIIYLSNRFLSTDEGWLLSSFKELMYTTFHSMREINDNEKIRDEFLTI